MRARACALFFLLAACHEAPPAQEAPSETTFPDHWTPATPADHGPGTLAPVVTLDGKIARRMSVDQLRRSIPKLFGGITWTIGRQRTVGFDALSRTLGEADYIQANTNNLDASPLFAKFMDDMAGDVCGKAVAHDHTAAPADKVLVRYDDVAENLRFLRLALHGILVPPDTTEGISELLQLFDEVAIVGTTDDAWLAVCVAMLTAPELLAY